MFYIVKKYYMKLLPLLLIAILTVSVFNSCENMGGEDEGQVTYELKYLDSEKEKPIISLLPTELEYKFKDDNYMQQVEGWMGIFKMAGLANRDKNQNSALLKIMADKYVYQGDAAFGYNEYNGMKIEFTKNKKDIAGLKCKEALVKFPNGEYEDFKVFYTDEIKIENPNFFNPFKEIPGVLMEYQYEMFGIKTKIKAIKFEPIEIGEEEFEVPEGYVNVPKEKMEEVINNLM